MLTDRHWLALLLAAGTAGLGLPRPPAPADSPPPPPDLTDYVNKPDPSFAWKLASAVKGGGATTYEIDLVSQTWHGVRWEHKLLVFVPADVKPRPTMVLFNTGGRPNPTSALLGSQLAAKVGAPVAFLFGVPAQPLFGGLTEDALIAETFVRFLDSKDPTWPLLFPMAKSAVRAMDALQAFAREEWKAEVKDFVVTGASKRGWTSWLTAATGDRRVKAIAPLVIDTLNLPVQMGNQVRAFGKPSEMIRPYTDRKLIPIPDTPEARKLWTMIDPWVYRDRITVPKMIVNGANDPYWPLDALNSYWDDLKGPKYALYVPNAGHDLREVGDGGGKELIPARAVNTLAAFCKSQVYDRPLPRLTWALAAKPDGAAVAAESDVPMRRFRVWEAVSDTRDFRPARWAPVGGEANVYKAGAAIGPPAKGYRAAFIEAEYDLDGLTYTLSTQLQIVEAKK